LLRSAGVSAEFLAVPGPNRVNKSIVKRARAELHDRLSAEGKFTGLKPDDSEVEYAKLLLERHDPVVLVATLLGMGTPKLPREPMPISAVTADSDRGPRQERPRNQRFDRFVASWGSRQGATVARVVSHLCRRCGISSQAIGAVRIDVDRTMFDVDSSVAREFEDKASRPDPRDPTVVIRRAPQGARDYNDARQSERPRRGPPPRRGPSGAEDTSAERPRKKPFRRVPAERGAGPARAAKSRPRAAKKARPAQKDA
jgi:hypothetical protein